MSGVLNIPDNKRAGNSSSLLLKALIIGGALLVVLAAIIFPKFHYVDQRPALACGDEYFSKLKQGHLDNALEMYTAGFRQTRGEEWQKLLAQLDAQNGVVTNFRPINSKIFPVQLRDSTEMACVVAQYQVNRNTLISEEKLTLCPHQRGTEWGIAGHEIIRSDTGQRYEAGVTLREKTVHFNFN
jgi:hypothetical protein